MKQPSSRQIILERMERAYASRTITDDPKDGQAECLEEDLSQNKFFQDDILSLSEMDKMAYFCHMLESLKGECILCEDEQDMYEKMSNLMQKKVCRVCLPGMHPLQKNYINTRFLLILMKKI